MITGMILKNFKGHKETRLSFNPGKNAIRGPNEVGKTAVDDAISFVFYGCDQYGNRNPDHLIMFGEEATEGTITTDKASFVRRKQRGQTSVVQLIRPGIPPIKMSQTELTQALGISFEVFASCYNVGFFMDLPQAKKLEVIGQIAQLSRVDLLRELAPHLGMHPKVKLENIKVDLQVISSERRLVQNQLASDQGALSQVETQIKEFKSDVGGFDLNEAKNELTALTAQADLFDLYKSELIKYQSAQRAAKEQENTNKVLAATREKLELELKSLGDSSAPKISRLTEQREQIQAKCREISISLEALPSPPAVADPDNRVEIGSCPRCGQTVSEKLKEGIEREKERAINKYNQIAREVADRNSSKHDYLDSAREKINQLTDEIVSLHEVIQLNKSRRIWIEGHLSELNPVHVTALKPPVKPDGDETVIRDRLNSLRAKYYAHQTFALKQEQMAAREDVFRKSIQQKSTEIEKLATLEEALKRLPELEVRRTLERLRTPGVVIRFTEDELVVTNDRFIPYQSLSAGRKIKMSLELSKTFQKLVPRAPHFYFIDNADLVDDYSGILPGGDEQVFIAKVDTSVSELQIDRL